MKVIKVNLGERSYPIIIGANLLGKVGKLVKTIPNVNIALVITNSTIKALYGSKLANSLHSAGIRPIFILVADSERSKSIDAWVKVIHKITRFDRGGGIAVIAFGGGVVGDLSGFVAACYKRGVPLVQVATTLLAQVDSAIGGKTAVDLPFGKNLVGAFYQPEMVISDIKLVMSLPLTEVKNGIAEIIKYAVILDKNLFLYLEKNLNKLLKLNKDCLSYIVSRCSRLKAKVVSIDEKETSGYRSILNFGHTIGHALETSASYTRKMAHGRAIVLGMLCACDIARELNLLSEKDAGRIEDLIKAANLPTSITKISASKVLNATLYDKKIIAGKERFILPVSIGHVMVCSNIDRSWIKKSIDKRIKQ